MRSLVHAILTGATGVDHEFDVGDGPESRPTNAQVRGSGGADTDVPAIDAVGSHDEGPLTIVNAGPLELVVARVVGTDVRGRADARGDLEGRHRRRDRGGAPGLSRPCTRAA